MEKLIQLITKLYGKSALSKTLGTRTNVITLSDNETKRFIKEELNIEAASDAAAQAAKDKAENLIADIPKMNDQEILTFTGNLQRLDNKLNPPSAEVVQMGSKEVVPAEGIEQLAAGQTAKRLMDETISMAEKRQRSANEGLIRTAVRFKMIKDLREGKLKVPEEIAQSISQVGSSRNDPIKLFEKYYGPDALEIVDELSPEFRMIERRGGTEMDLVTKIEQNVDARPLTPQEISDMAANTREAGRVRQEVEEGNIIPLTGKDPEEFATGGRVGLKNGSEDVITITDKIDELISFYQDYLKQGGKMNFITFAKKYIPENFATGGRVGFDDGGLGSLPTGLQMDTTTSNPIPENAPNMAADEIAKVIMGTGFLPEEDDELGYPEGMEKPMSSKLFIFEQYVIPQRKKMMENFGLTLKEADDLIRQEMEKYRTNKATGGRVGFQIGGPAYDATDPIYGSSAITVTPDTIMGPQGNQIQAQTGVNPALQRSQNPFQNLGFLNTQKHFDQNQLLKNAVASGEITPEQYNELGGYDVTQTMAAGNPVMGGIGNLLGSTAYNVVQSLKGDQPFSDIPGDVFRNVKGGMGFISDDLKSKYESIINPTVDQDRISQIVEQQKAAGVPDEGLITNFDSTPTPDASASLTQYSNIPELTRLINDNSNINSLAEANDYLKMQAGVVPGFTRLKNPNGAPGNYNEFMYKGPDGQIYGAQTYSSIAAGQYPDIYDPNKQTLASGGRVGYAYGSGKKLLDVLKQKGKDITQEIKKAVDNIYTTDDIKYDADVAVDDMLETLGIDRSEIDEKDILDAYGMAYDELKKPLLEKLRNKPVENLAPKMTERFELKEKYPGIDDDLLTAIIDDPDPNNKAQVLATLEQLMELQRQGKTPEEAADIIKQTMFKGRRDNSQGGLNYLSGF